MQKEFDFEKILSNKKNFSRELKKETKKFDELEDLLSKERRISLEIKKQIPDFEGNALINCVPENNHEVLISLINEIILTGKKPLVILTSINYKTATELFMEAKIDPSKVFLIDTISKNIVKVQERENLKFIDSLRSLTQIQIKLLEIIENKDDFVVVFDSINILELYHSEKILLKFIYALTKVLHKFKLSGNFIICDGDLLLKFGQFFDNLVDIDKVD